MADVSDVWSALYDSLGRTSLRKYSAHSTVLFQGEVPPLAFFVQKGFVAAYTINNSGDEQIIGFFSAGDIIPTEWLFNRSPVSLYYYRAFTDCELVACSRETLLTHIKADPALTAELLNRYVSSFIGATIHIHALEHSHAHEKLIKLFHYLVLRFGEPQNGKKGVYTIPFQLTHAHIASMIGLTRETVAIESLKLKKNGMLSYKRGQYTVNLPRLIRAVGSEEFDNLEL